MKSLIKAVKKAWHKSLVMCRFRKDVFHYETFIYVYEDGRICRNGKTSIVRFLDKFKVEAYSKTEADFEAKRVAKEKYPDYAGALWFW